MIEVSVTVVVICFFVWVGMVIADSRSDGVSSNPVSIQNRHSKTRPYVNYREPPADYVARTGIYSHIPHDSHRNSSPTKKATPKDRNSAQR